MTVAFDQTRHAIAEGGVESAVICRIRAPPDGFETVRFHIALIHDPEPEFIGEVEHSRVRWVVGRADGVDAAGLHELELVAHGVGRNVPTPHGVVLMTVDPTQRDRHAVHGEHTIANGDAPKADRQFDRLVSGPPPGRHPQGVQTRRLRTPWLDLDADLGTEGKVGGDAHQFDIDGVGINAAGQINVNAQEPGTVRPLGGCTNRVDAVLWPLLDDDLTDDSGQPPRVLVLEVGGGAEVMEAHKQFVVASNQSVEREFDREPTSAGAADVGARPPDVGGALHPLESQHSSRGKRPLPPHAGPIVSNRIHVRRVWRVDGERVAHVRVDRRPVGPAHASVVNGHDVTRWHTQAARRIPRFPGKGCAPGIGEPAEVPHS